jgi:hypothetical protein
MEGVKAMQEIMYEVNAQTNVAFIPSEVKALGIADTYSTFGDRPLRVLSLGMIISCISPLSINHLYF